MMRRRAVDAIRDHAERVILRGTFPPVASLVGDYTGRVMRTLVNGSSLIVAEEVRELLTGQVAEPNGWRPITAMPPSDPEVAAHEEALLLEAGRLLSRRD